MKCELRNVKISRHLSEETTAFTATLYIGAIKAAQVSNHGTGGPNMVYFDDRSLEAKFEAYVKALPPVPCEWGDGKPLDMDVDLYIGTLLDEYEAKQWLQKQCRKQTLFRLTGEQYQPGEWQVVKAPYSPAVRAFLETKYGSRIAEIANEQFTSPSKGRVK